MAFGRIGSFTILSTLGSGAHSTILHIRRGADQKEYALKVVNINSPEEKKFLVQMEHEYRVGQMLNHPTLVKIYTYEVHKNWLLQPKKAYLLTEFIKGVTLDQAKLLNIPRLVRVCERVAEGLNYMHTQKVFHGDIKPNNVLLMRGLRPKIIDFGLSTVAGEPRERIQGTPEYLAPETATSRLVNAKSDIFNFGAMLYRLVTFQLPPSVIPTLPGTKMSAKTYAGLLKPAHELNPVAPKELCEIIHDCLAFNPTDRPESMARVHKRLQLVADSICDSLDLEFDEE